jgi:hypothetical protein
VGSTFGTKIPRPFSLPGPAQIFAGLALVTAATAFLGLHDWWLPAVVAGIAVALVVLPMLSHPTREFVQIDESGVAVQTKKGIDQVLWSELERVRILTTSGGPWVEDVFFVLEAPGGRGCAVPHSAAVRIKLLEELQSRLPGVRDDKVIEAMSCATKNSFTIWEKAQHGVA